jgi:hypothetical protein
VPDELAKSGESGRAQLIDLIDGYFEFCEGLPALLNAEGFPRSWRHYVYGMSYLARSRVRSLLDMAEATRAAGAVEEHWKQWVAERRKAEKRT